MHTLAFLQNMGPSEWIIILVIALLLFGATRLPKLARSLGKSANEFKEGLREGARKEDDESEAQVFLDQAEAMVRPSVQEKLQKAAIKVGIEKDLNPRTGSQQLASDAETFQFFDLREEIVEPLESLEPLLHAGFVLCCIGLKSLEPAH